VLQSPFIDMAAVIKLVIVGALSIGLRPMTATRHGPLTPKTVRLIGTFKRGVPRNKSATFSWLAAGGNPG
jgi:hypothetical protein